MKQVTQTQRDGHVRIEEIPQPSLRPGGVLVRTAYSVISAGTERARVELAQKSLVGKARERPEQARQALETLHQQGPLTTYRKVMNRLESLQPLGYSCAGVVIAVGADAEGFQVGDWVACAGAGYANHAEINFVPRNLCVKVPRQSKGIREKGNTEIRKEGGIGLDEAAFATLGAIAMQGVRQADVRLGETVAVVGLGLVGLLTVQILKAAGCQVLGMDVNPDRCRLAEELGADVVASDSSTALRLPSSAFGLPGCDAVILTAATSSNEPVTLAGHISRGKGRVVVVGAVGMEVPRSPYYEKELDLRLSRSYGPGRYDPNYEEKGHDYPYEYVRWTEKRNMEAFLQIIAEGKVDVRSLITHRFPIEQAPDAYELITEGDEPYLAVLLEYGEWKGEGGRGKREEEKKEIREEEEKGKGKGEGGEGRTDDGKGSSDEGSLISLEPVADGKVWVREPTADSTPQPVQSRKSILHSPFSILRSPSSDARPPMSVGLIGAGNFAQDVLIPALKATKQAHLRGVVTASGLSARSVAERFGFEYAASNPTEVIDDPDVDAIIIATRHDTHASLAVEVLKARKPVFVEKPLALNREQLQAIVEAYRENGMGKTESRERGTESAVRLPFSVFRSPSSVLQVGFNRRFSPYTQAVKEFFAVCTEPLAIHCRVNAGYLSPDHWLHDPEMGGGRIVGEGCHFVDLLMYLAGSEPVEVYAKALPNNGRYRQDNVSVQIRFANGAIGTLNYLANGDKRMGKERIEVFGGGATAVIDDFRRATLTRNGKTKNIGRWWSRQDKGHRAEMGAFLEAVRSGGSSPTPFAQVVLSTLTTFKVLESLQTGAAVSVRGFDKIMERR